MGLEPSTCSIVLPWDVDSKHAKANMEALRLRGSLVPYLYTAAYRAHKTGRWFTVPMYYNWPELEGAYETATLRPDPSAKYEPQYLFGDDMWAAPVVKPANSTDGLDAAVGSAWSMGWNTRGSSIER
jgi:alpha-glucosidase (family GH31 glycosyl hydrolase)